MDKRTKMKEKMSPRKIMSIELNEFHSKLDTCIQHLITLIQAPIIESVNEWQGKMLDEITEMQTRVTSMNRNNNRIRVTETINTKIEICLRCSSQEKCKCLKTKS